GNPSSVHHFGQQAKAAIDEARTEVANLIGAEPSEVLFTSGGTEADNIAIRGAAEALEATGKRHLIASAIEHEAVLNTLKALAKRGWRTTLLPVGQSGIVSVDTLRNALTDDTAVVSVMHANNEIGTIQPIAGMGVAARMAIAKMAEEGRRLAALRDRLEADILRGVSGTAVNGSTEARVPNTTNISFDRVEAESLLIALDLEGVAVSTGSAC